MLVLVEKRVAPIFMAFSENIAKPLTLLDFNLHSLQLTEMRIVPYSQRTNTFLAEVKNDKGAEFWNELNLSLFVTIQVSGQAGSYSSNRQVEFTAYEGGQLILKRVSRLGVLDEKTGKYYVPVWLYSPICQPLRIKAKLVGQGQSSVLERNLAFNCGE